MRSETDRAKIDKFMISPGNYLRSPGRIYFTGGTTAILYGWRETTIDIDLRADPEPAGFFEAIARLKDDLDVNVELASPADFIPALPHWRDRSLFIARHGPVDFFHYDPYGQVLAKLQRRHERDLRDVESLVNLGLVRRDKLWKLFGRIEPQLIRYPAIDTVTFREVVSRFCNEETNKN